MEPSAQQAAIYQWVKKGEGSAIFEARAGTGKTTTLVDSTKLMKGNVAFMAYNKKIAEEIKFKIGGKPGIDCGTFHSFGMKGWRKISTKFEVDERKVQTIIEEKSIPRLYSFFVKKSVSLAKQWGIGIDNGPGSWDIDDFQGWMQIVDHFDLRESLAQDEDRSDETFEEILNVAIGYAIEVLKTSNALGAQVIDFDDMIYLPLLKNAQFFRYDWVLVDEAQDTNPTRRMLAERLLKPGGRLIAVGDPYQAIYGFTGANSDAMDQIADRFDCARFPLTITYRCPKVVVKVAQTWVKDIEAHPTAPEGIYQQMAAQTFRELDALLLDKTSAVLCRNTKPLLDIAFALIKRDIACHVEGRDIGLSLIKLMERWPRIKNLGPMSDKLREFRDREVEKLMNTKKEIQAELLADKVDCLLTIIEMMPPNSEVIDVRAKIERLFGDTPEGRASENLTLSTIHKSKGREWNRVYWYGRNLYQPSKYAKQDWQIEQEINVFYVAATRSKSELIEVQV